MALPLVAIGDVLAHGLTGKKIAPKAGGLLNGANFGSALQQKLGQTGMNGGLLSQIAGMLQAGMPLATIIDRVAKMLSSALASATGNQGNANRQSTLERALANALAPPGTSPPMQSGIEQAASLEHRLADLLSKVAGELENAGQQNRIPGAVLDANSARETPAQRQTNSLAGLESPASALAFAQSILQSVVQQLQGAASQTPMPHSASPAIADRMPHMPQSPQSPQVPEAAQPARPVQFAQAAQIAPGERITVQSADVLGRMLARAANADAQRSSGIRLQSPPAQTAVPVKASAGPSYTTAASPSDLFARLMNAIAQASNERSPGGGENSPQEFASFKNALPATHHTDPQGGTPSSGPSFSTAVAAAAPSAQQPPEFAAASHAVNPQSVIEQVVQGIVLRNFGTTSEVRMQLQPAHLGNVSLKLTVTGNTISANIVAQNADVRDMLLANQQLLARTLAGAGLALGSFSVDVSGGNPGFSRGHVHQQRSLSKANSRSADVAEEELWADPRLGPPVLAGSKSLVLNYLA